MILWKLAKSRMDSEPRDTDEAGTVGNG
jgi:hypothetical protein